MNKYQVNVPSYVRYISEWEGYEIPYGKCIIDKKVCGCGYTQLSLENSDNIILCSPRKSLLENKAEQNTQCFYFKSIKLSKKQLKLLGIDQDDKQQINQQILSIQKQEVYDYLQWCRQTSNPCKFLVTYDSLKKLLEILNFFNINLDYFKTIVDEFQLIFFDSRFKAEVELNFVEILNQYCRNICFLSSTPMLEDYLVQMPEFQGLDYYEFCWGKHQIILPNITKIESKNLEKSIMEIIELYKEGKGPTKIVNGIEYRSTEAVFYVSNVSMITSVIKKLKLSPSEVNIICSSTSSGGGSNNDKIRKCGKGFKIGKIPLKGQPHKMFTFCTSTAFCGVDFYSTNAKSYVFSNCNEDTMSIDISIELPQIIGRQRLPENVFRYDIVFYYQSNIKSITEEDFLRKLQNKNNKTSELLQEFSSLKKTTMCEVINDRVKTRNYSDDFICLNNSGNAVYNNLVYLSELRAWELQNKIYDNDLSVLRVLDEVGKVTGETSFLDEIVSLPYFEDRMKEIITYVKNHPEDLPKVPEKYKYYLENIPMEELVLLDTTCLTKYNLDRILKQISKVNSKITNEIIEKVYKIFIPGEVYTKNEIRSELNKIYQGNFNSKGTDIKLYFETSRAQITNKITKKSEEGFRLLKKKY